jgi:hypothetical protein
LFSITSANAFYPQLIIRNSANDDTAAYLILRKDRNLSGLSTNDDIGTIIFSGRTTAGSYTNSAYIAAEATANASGTGVPSKFTFFATDTSSTLQEILTLSPSAFFYKSDAVMHAGNVNEVIDDRVNALIVAGSGIGITYDDTANTLTLTATGGGATSYFNPWSF